ncbi:hypothetical protein SAMN04487917_101326 [Arthrobacter sp. yr096]|uniref:hypothetical protein n=1 Tax=Arthrobacter sp. yr096 TaxID=1761750 RepID=UPI0008C26487|nr:hypothetical protein [Arthrobacter sp. yr096]SEI44470.1 hypothetical protein SAMN04487917_101326 [Arthrobacter sp. yr096]
MSIDPGTDDSMPAEPAAPVAEFQDRTPDGLVWTPAETVEAAKRAASDLQTEWRKVS